MSNSAFPPPICAGFSPAYAHADPARFFGWRPRAVATVLLFSRIGIQPCSVLLMDPFWQFRFLIASTFPKIKSVSHQS